MKSNKPTLKLWGKIILALGITLLITGFFLLAFAASNFAVWTIIISIVFNVTGITFLSHKSN